VSFSNHAPVDSSLAGEQLVPRRAEDVLAGLNLALFTEFRDMAGVDFIAVFRERIPDILHGFVGDG